MGKNKIELENKTEFVSKLIFVVQNSRFVKVNAYLEEITISMHHFEPVGKSSFSVNGNLRECNFKEWAEQIHDKNFNEIVF